LLKVGSERAASCCRKLAFVEQVRLWAERGGKSFEARWVRPEPLQRHRTTPLSSNLKCGIAFIVAHRMVKLCPCPVEQQRDLAFGSSGHRLMYIAAGQKKRSILAAGQRRPMEYRDEAGAVRHPTAAPFPSGLFGSTFEQHTVNRYERRPAGRPRRKVEINTRERFARFGLASSSLTVSSRWFARACDITTYALNELRATAGACCCP
jgi:hypothetical protein